MTNIEFRFPGELPYTYFNVSGTPEELTQVNYELLAALYVNAQKAVIMGSIQAKQAIAPKPQVQISDIVKEIAAESTRPDSPVASPLGKQYEESAKALKEYAVGDSVEVAGTTFTKHSEAATVLSEGLGGATEIPDVNAPPWDKPKPAAKAKPWESEKPKTEVSSDDFDF